MTIGLAAETDYTPLTRDQARDWVMSNLRSGISGVDVPILVHFDLLDFVIMYDYIEHTVPDVPTPEYTIIVTKDDVLLVPADGKVNWVLGSAETGTLVYELSWPNYEFKDVLPRKKCNWLLPTVIGVGVGVVATAVIVALVN